MHTETWVYVEIVIIVLTQDFLLLCILLYREGPKILDLRQPVVRPPGFS